MALLPADAATPKYKASTKLLATINRCPNIAFLIPLIIRLSVAREQRDYRSQQSCSVKRFFHRRFVLIREMLDCLVYFTKTAGA